MTHKDIYTKFMIEYDKANVTSSYPSLTEYEVATLLDKAYLALIAQKATGNNPRRAMFEADNKAIADIAPLITHKELELFTDGHEPAVNIIQYKLPKDFLYYVSSALNQKMIPTNPSGDRLLEPEVYVPADIKFEAEDDDSWVKHSDVYYGVDSSFDTTSDTIKTAEAVKKGLPYDGDQFRLVPMRITTHQIAEKFFNTPYNMPWVKIPVTYAEGDSMFVVYDPINKPMLDSTAHLSYIRKPLSFVQLLTEIDNQDQNPTNPEPTEQGNPDDPTPHTPEQNPNDDEQGNQGGSQTHTDNTDTQMHNASAVFNFDNPESLNPSITRSPYEGGGVECENIQFASSDGKVSITFDNSNVTPKSNARIVTNNAANNKVPYLTFERGEKLIISVTGGMLKKVRIPGGDIIGGLIYDSTYPQQNIGTFTLASDNQYNQWENSGDQDVTKLVLINNAPIPPAISSIEVFYTTQETTTQQDPSGNITNPSTEDPVDNEKQNDNPSTADYSSEYSLSNIDGMTADFLNYDENRLERSIYLSQKISIGQVSNASEFNNLFAFFATKGTPIYTSNKKVELRGYYNNDTVATGKFIQTTMTSDEYGNTPPTSAIRVQFDTPIQNGSLSSRRYVLVIYRGTFGDSKFGEYMQNPSEYLQSGKLKSDCHTNEYLYYFVDLV